MTLDIFLPELQLAVEYQGNQHYKMHFLFGSPSDQQQRDAEKRQQCRKLGISLIEVPYWWDKNKASLVATIHHVRPDTVPMPTNAVPIPASYTRKKVDFDVMDMPKQWPEGKDPTGW